jgi:hypothetical protein
VVRVLYAQFPVAANSMLNMEELFLGKNEFCIFLTNLNNGVSFMSKSAAFYSKHDIFLQ